MTVTPQRIVSQEQCQQFSCGMILIMSALRRSAGIKLEIPSRNERWLQQLWGLHSIQASCEIPLTSTPETCLAASTMLQTAPMVH